MCLPILVQNSLWGQVIQHCSKSETDGVVLAKSLRRSWSDRQTAADSTTNQQPSEEDVIEYPPTPEGSDAPSFSGDEDAAAASHDYTTTTAKGTGGGDALNCGHGDDDSDFE